MSRPDMGLATMPRVEPGTTGSSDLVTALTGAVHLASTAGTRVAAVLQRYAALATPAHTGAVSQVP
jgi:glucose-6-phosphate-specific signal transduction histidine kinase